MTPKDALKKLLDGNARFVSGLRSVNSLGSTTSQRTELAEKGQKPFAMILSCADSRVPSEYVFDVGLGELFVTRVAGNVVDVNVVGSLEFAALTFNTPVCIVMGHTLCGAVDSCIKSINNPDFKVTPSIRELLMRIEPSVRETQKNHADHSHLDSATKRNVTHSIDELLDRSPTLADLVKKGNLVIVGCVYDIKSGAVSVVDDRFAKDGNSNSTEANTGVKKASAKMSHSQAQV